MTIAYVAAILLLELICLCISATIFFEMMLFFVSGYLDVPFVQTPRAVFPAIITALSIAPNDVVYELGSGDARFLIAAAQSQPEALFVGIERNPLLHMQARLRKWVSGNPHNTILRRGNLFKTDLSEATKVYAYLLTSVMNDLLPTFEKEFHGTLASRAFQFNEKAPLEVIELSKKPGAHGQHRLYVYEF